MRSAAIQLPMSVQPTPWPARLLFSLCALSFALFVRVTFYGQSGFVQLGVKGLPIPIAVLGALAAWYLAAEWLMPRLSQAHDRRLGVPIAATFLPMLAMLPVAVGVFALEPINRTLWEDRSLKIYLLLIVPALVLLLQVGLGVWIRNLLTWRLAAPVMGVLAVGFGLRLAGVAWGLPFAFQPEESSIYLRLANDVALKGFWNPHYFENPSLLAYLLGAEFAGVFALGNALFFSQEAGNLYMLFRGEQGLFYGLARLDSVLLGTGTVLLVYLIGRRLWGERAGLVGALLLAVNFLHVRNSQYAVNDVPSTFFLLLSMYYAVRIAETGRGRYYLLAGLAAGLAASTKYNAGMVVVAVAVAHWVCWGRAGVPSRGAFRPRPLAMLILSAAVALLAFVLGTPYSVLDYPTFYASFMAQLNMGQTAWSGQAQEETAWLFLTGLVQGAGIVVAILALAGAVLLARRDWRRAVLVLACPVAYFAFMSAMELFFVRWVVPAMPFVALLAAYTVERVAGASPRGRRNLVVVALVGLALLQPAAYSLRLDWLAHQRDTRQDANTWAEQNIPQGSKVAVEAYSLLDQESLTFRPTLHGLDVELDWRATMHDLPYYRQNGFDYLAISSFMYDRAFERPDKYADRIEFYRQLERENSLVAVFSPRADGTPVPFDLDDTDTPFWHLFSYDRPGPTVKVYRLSR